MHKIVFGFGLGCFVTALVCAVEINKQVRETNEEANKHLQMWRDATIELAKTADPKAVLRVADNLEFNLLVMNVDIPTEEGKS